MDHEQSYNSLIQQLKQDMTAIRSDALLDTEHRDTNQGYAFMIKYARYANVVVALREGRSFVISPEQWDCFINGSDAIPSALEVLTYHYKGTRYHNETTESIHYETTLPDAKLYRLEYTNHPMEYMERPAVSHYFTSWENVVEFLKKQPGFSTLYDYPYDANTEPTHVFQAPNYLAKMIEHDCDGIFTHWYQIFCLEVDQ